MIDLMLKSTKDSAFKNTSVSYESQDFSFTPNKIIHKINLMQLQLLTCYMSKMSVPVKLHLNKREC